MPFDDSLSLHWAFNTDTYSALGTVKNLFFVHLSPLHNTPTHMNISFSRELGDKCLEVSRCLAEMSVIKQELIDKTNLLHASQEMIDKMRLDADKMRKEFNQFDEQIANTKYQTEVMRLQSNYLVSKSVIR